MNKAFERLDIAKTYLHPAVSTRLPVFGAALFTTKLGLLLLNPRRRVYVVSHATPPSRLLRRLLGRLAELLFFDVHDDPRLQFRDLGIEPKRSENLDVVGERIDGAMAEYRLVGFATKEFSDLYAVPEERKVIVPNASDPDHFPLAPLPEEPVVALVGGASPGRGADLLIEAAILAREQIPKLRLRLALYDIGGRGNLDELRARFRRPWISWEQVDYRGLAGFLGGATVCAIPHRRSQYLDLALPIKLFDYMAAARPMVVTECREMAAFVERHRVGLVARETPEDLAEQLVALLGDPALAEELGGNGRRLVEERYSWRHTQEALLAAIRPVLSP